MVRSKPQSSVQAVPASIASAYHVVKSEEEDAVDTTSIVRRTPINSQKDTTIPPQIDRQTGLLQIQEKQPLLMEKTQKNLRQTYERATADYWTYELVGVFVCVGSLCSIIAILFAYQGKPTPQVMGSITLNTAISLLATLSRASAALVASSVIAQQKWLRFERNTRSLIEMLLYDDATRGPLGSLYLLGTLRMSLVTASAAVVMVLALGFESFIQQSVKYPTKDLPILMSSIPSLPIVGNVSITNHPLWSSLNTTLAVASAVSRALYADSVKPLQSNCAATACEWSPYESVAFCSYCEDAMGDVAVEPKLDLTLQEYFRDDYLNAFNSMDMTDVDGYFHTWSLSRDRDTTYEISLGQGDLTSIILTTNFDWDIGVTSVGRNLWYPQTVVWNLSPLNDEVRYDADWANMTINGIRGPLTAFGYVRLGLSPNKEQLIATSAKRCVISLCTQKYSSSFRNGSLASNVTERDWGSFSNEEGMITPLWNATLGDSRFADTYEAWWAFLRVSMKEIEKLNGLTMLNTSGSWPRYSSDSEYIQGASTDTMRFISDIQNSSAKIAQELTNLIQTYGNKYAEGQAYENRSVVEVHWVWLTFPVALVFLVLGSLIATMNQTKREYVPVWKSSPFPLLFNYYRQDGHEESTGKDESAAYVPQAVTTSRHKEMAESTYLRLRSTAGNWIMEDESPPIGKIREPFLPAWITGLFRWRSKHHTV